MNIFDQYGIKEVADVTLYSIHKKTDGSGEVYYVPALHLDTLKVSTVEKTAESTWAEGGVGNARLINWDHSKQINVTLEDALCTPASLGLCWNGVLSANWKNAELNYNSEVTVCESSLQRLDRFEKATYPRSDRKTVSRLLPQVPSDTESIDELELLRVSSIVDGTVVKGSGMVGNKTYNWKMAIESAVKSIAVVPDRFFDVNGKSYSIDWNRKVSVDSLPDYKNYKDAIIYRINTRSGMQIPTIATIIYDNEMQNRRGLEHSITLDVSGFCQKKDPETQELVNVGTFKLTKVLADLGCFYEGGYFVTTAAVPPTASDNDTTYVPDSNDITDLTQYENKLHYLLCPLDRTITVDSTGHIDGGTTVEIRVFTLNSYGIAKYLNNDNVKKVTIDDLTGTLVTYLQNHATTQLFKYTGNDDYIIEDKYDTFDNIDKVYQPGEGDYLAIVVDQLNNYYALIGKVITPLDVTAGTAGDNFAQSTVNWGLPMTDVNVSQFKGIDMWLRFESINAMIYFLITKYEQDIVEIRAGHICPKHETKDGNWDVNRNVTAVHNSTETADKAKEGRLWAYLNPRTGQPYLDDYWFHNGDPYYIKSLTIAQDKKAIKGNKIVVKADQWPGVYMVIGETRIRNRDTEEDERMQIKFPQCKVKSDQTLTLTADGEPTTFSLNLEVAKPRNGHMMEITTYEVATKMVEGDNGCFYAVDGSSEVVVE